MAISVVAVGTAQQAVDTGTASISVTPTLPAGTAAGDRVYLVVANVPTTVTPTTPTGFTLVSTQALGTGTLGSNTGLRTLSIYYIDYDGSTAIPTVTLPSAAAPALLAQTISITKGGAEAWNTPTSTFGSDTTATGTVNSATGGANLSYNTGDWAMVGWVAPGQSPNQSAQAIAATGATFGTVTEQADWPSVSATNGLKASISEALTTGGPSSAAPVFTATTGASGVSAGGAIFIRQTVSAAPTVTLAKGIPHSPARFRAANW